ncbi:MAG: hypothetical protein IPF53_18905 [Blastocatellia bacterium]|nr:hypothetical protein [Blastocatellia bacterium]MBK6425739.1 hypothetical protein [Blastocatellia bacterium]
MRDTYTLDSIFAGPLRANRADAGRDGAPPVVASSDDAQNSAAIRRPSRGHSSAISRLASTVVRVAELSGRFADVASMRRRLEASRDRAMVRVALAEQKFHSEREIGRDFCAARARIEVEDSLDDAVEASALLAELDIVSRNLERERRVLAARLSECASVAEALLTEHDRSRARMIIDEAFARLDLPAKAGHQTLTRGDTKQYGQAR